MVSQLFFCSLFAPYNHITTTYLYFFAEFLAEFLQIVEKFVYLQTETGKWSDGRVARQRSAKPRTAVRIRFRPQNQMDNKLIYSELSIFLFMHSITLATYLLHKHAKTAYLEGKRSVLRIKFEQR